MILRDFHTVKEDRLHWQQPKFGADHYQLLVGDHQLAEIYWTKMFSDQATARTSRASWNFARLGFFRSGIRAEDAATGIETARIELNWWDSGEITCAGGRKFTWQKLGFWGDRWVFTAEGGGKLFDFWFGMHWFKRTGDVLLSPGAGEEPELPLLICLGWYMATCDAQDAAGAVAAGGSVAAIL